MNRNMLLLLGGGAILLWYLDQKKNSATTASPSVPSALLTNAPGTGPGNTPNNIVQFPTTFPTPKTNPTPVTVQQPPVLVADPNYSTPTQQAIEAAINASGVSSTYIYGQQSPDTWNWYAMQAAPGWSAPAPEALFPGVPNVHDKPVSFNDWYRALRSYSPPGSLSGFVPRSAMFNRVYGGWMA